MRGSSRLRQLERVARRKRRTLERSEEIRAHDWVMENERWDLFNPMAEAAEECIDALESGDDDALAKASESFNRTQEAMMKAYNERKE